MHARVLRYLDEVVRRGSIRKAAEHLHVAPTAVNRQILDLEAELGAPLFDRIHNRLRLTPLGEMVLTHVRSTLREHAALRERIADFKGMGAARSRWRRRRAWRAPCCHRWCMTFAAAIRGWSCVSSTCRRRPLCLPWKPGRWTWVLPTICAQTRFAHAGGQRMADRSHPAGQHPLAHHSSLLLSECVGHPLILPAPALTIRSLLDEASRAVPSR
jgi:molybdenum-dependent DNA-binding transcriptional regulator ModE